MAKVYLAGPITGLSYGGCTDWRKYACEQLANTGIVGVSPLRAKDYLKNETAIGDSYEHIALSTSRAITTRDRFDCVRADTLLVNLLGAERVSIGTVMEIAWADAARVPVVLVMEPAVEENTGLVASKGNVHEHAMLRECVGFRVQTLDEGLNVVKAILGVYA